MLQLKGTSNSIMVNRGAMKSLLQHAKESGLFYSVTFTKQNGEERHLVGRGGVKMGVTGKGMSWSPEKRGYQVLFDVHKKGWRMANVENASAAVIRGQRYQIIGEKR